jgi:serine/threonine-protein phosphatase 2B regulatory subunit
VKGGPADGVARAGWGRQGEEGARPGGGCRGVSASGQWREHLPSRAAPTDTHTLPLARAQVEKLYELFKVISSSGDDDGLIDKSEFQQALGLKRNLFVDRMFELFDANGDKNINFTEFVAGLSVFTKRAKGEEKARFSFRMYDFNADGKIDKAELGRMLQATIEENSLNITPEAAQELLDATFAEAECAEAGTMTFDEYQALVTKKPQLLEFMTITSLNQVIS